MSNNGERQGQIDAQRGKPPQAQGSKTYAEQQNYLTGHRNGTKK